MSPLDVGLLLLVLLCASVAVVAVGLRDARSDWSSDRTPRFGTPARATLTSGSHGDGSASAPEDGGLCSACGAVNDPCYAFCRNCVRRLGTG